MSRSPMLVAFLGTATLAGLLAWGVLWQIEDVELPPPPEETQPEVINRSVDLIGRSDGVQRWRLLADEASMEGQQQRFDRGANGWFFGNTTADSADSLFFAEQDEIRWFADQAVFNSQQNRLSLRHNVAVSSTDGSELLTNALEITPEEHIDILERFTLRGNDVTLVGNSGIFDFAFSALTAYEGQLIASALEPDTVGTNEEVTIVADRLDYDRSTEIARGEGDLVIEQGNTMITSPRGTFKRRESQSLLIDGVVLEEPSRRLQSERMNGNHRDKIFLFEGGVEYRQSEVEGEDADLRRSETVVDASELIYNSVTERAQFSGPVNFTQRGRRGVADIADITPEMIILQGNVRIEQIEGDWLQLEDQEVQDTLERPTIIYAERVEIDQRTNDARFFQEVLIIQPNRAAEGDVATYLDGPQTLALTGESAPALLCDRGEGNTTDLSTVEDIPGQEALDATCRGADRISSSLITLDMANDTFTTEGQSQLQFRLPPDSAL